MRRLLSVLVSALMVFGVAHVARGEAQTTEGTVVAANETLTVKTAAGEELTFTVRTKNKEGKLVRDELPDIALKKALRPGMPITVKWEAGKEGQKLIHKLIATGTVTGPVVEPREKGVLHVAVEGIAGPMAFVTQWIKRGEQWMPDPKEVELFASAKTGAKVTVTYELEEHFRVKKLTVVPE